MPLRRLRPVTRDLVDRLRGLPDDPAAHMWGLGHGDPLPDWAEAALETWGMIGVSYHGPDGLGFLLVAPGDVLPPGHPMGRIPRASGAAVVVAALAPQPGHSRDAGSGHGRNGAAGHGTGHGDESGGGSGHGAAAFGRDGRDGENGPGRWHNVDKSTKRHDDSSDSGWGAAGSAVEDRDPFHSVAGGHQLTSFLVGRLHGSVTAIEAGGVETLSRDPRVAPTTWWERLGFRLVDPLDAAPVRRLQLDLRHTVVADDWGHRILGWVRRWSPAVSPEPNSAQRQ